MCSAMALGEPCVPVTVLNELDRLLVDWRLRAHSSDAPPYRPGETQWTKLPRGVLPRAQTPALTLSQMSLRFDTAELQGNERGAVSKVNHTPWERATPGRRRHHPQGLTMTNVDRLPAPLLCQLAVVRHVQVKELAARVARTTAASCS